MLRDSPRYTTEETEHDVIALAQLAAGINAAISGVRARGPLAAR